MEKYIHYETWNFVDACQAQIENEKNIRTMEIFRCMQDINNKK